MCNTNGLCEGYFRDLSSGHIESWISKPVSSAPTPTLELIFCLKSIVGFFPDDPSLIARVMCSYMGVMYYDVATQFNDKHIISSNSGFQRCHPALDRLGPVQELERVLRLCPMISVKFSCVLLWFILASLKYGTWLIRSWLIFVACNIVCKVPTVLWDPTSWN